MRARAGAVRPFRHRPDGQRGTILSPEILPDKMPLVASRRQQRVSERAWWHYFNISIYHAVTRPRLSWCHSAHHSANRPGRRPRRSPSQRASVLLAAVPSSGCPPQAFGPRQAERICSREPDGPTPPATSCMPVHRERSSTSPGPLAKMKCTAPRHTWLSLSRTPGGLWPQPKAKGKGQNGSGDSAVASAESSALLSVVRAVGCAKRRKVGAPNETVGATQKSLHAAKKSRSSITDRRVMDFIWVQLHFMQTGFFYPRCCAIGPKKHNPWGICMKRSCTQLERIGVTSLVAG